MSRRRIQTYSAVAVIAIGAVIVWAISSLEGVREVHPRFPMAVQLYGVYLMLLAPLALLPTPLPSLGRLGLWNALGLGIGGLVVGAARAGALLGVPVVCIGLGLALWPPVPRPDRDRVPAVILGIGGALAVVLPAVWATWG